jgi:hypothetical protein
MKTQKKLGEKLKTQREYVSLIKFIASTYSCRPSVLRASSAYSRGETLVPIL